MFFQFFNPSPYKKILIHVMNQIFVVLMADLSDPQGPRPPATMT